MDCFLPHFFAHALGFSQPPWLASFMGMDIEGVLPNNRGYNAQ